MNFIFISICSSPPCDTCGALITVSQCENTPGSVNLSCSTPYKINVATANYGLNDGICDSLIQLLNPYFWFNQQCKATSSLDKVKQVRQGKEFCDVKAENSVFGDPCPNVEKSLLIEYSCVKGKDYLSFYICYCIKTM